MILLTGGTGRTAQLLTPLLHKANQHVILTSRSGIVDPSQPSQSSHPVRFDWKDASTYEHPFKAAGSDPIDRVLLVLPPTLGWFPYAQTFIDFAIAKGVKRFVLLSATVCDIGESDMGRVHEYLAQVGVDYCILRPTWFFENFTTEQVESIRDENTLYTATEDGKVPWISVEDIADEACSALLAEGKYDIERFILGPDLYSYDEIAELLSSILGRTITHTRLSETEVTNLCLSAGLQREWAEYLSSLDVGIAHGSEERVFSRPDKVTGKRRLPDFLKANRNCWIVPSDV
ncbi:hypothetical protein B0H34DRAFT_665422 [Crassisporium funariophilum]|nr:hypothetical protein B0H34DRAFT_665422 [Crassisporium funariophilum]